MAGLPPLPVVMYIEPLLTPVPDPFPVSIDIFPEVPEVTADVDREFANPQEITPVPSVTRACPLKPPLPAIVNVPFKSRLFRNFFVIG